MTVECQQITETEALDYVKENVCPNKQELVGCLQACILLKNALRIFFISHVDTERLLLMSLNWHHSKHHHIYIKNFA